MRWGEEYRRPMQVGDLVKCRMFARPKNQTGVVVCSGERTVRIHFTTPEGGHMNPRWVSIEFLELINASR
jgi:hypothetical protein